MSEVYEHRRVAKQIAILPLEIFKRYQKWKEVETVSGPSSLRLIKGSHETKRRGWQDMVSVAWAYNTA